MNTVERGHHELARRAIAAYATSPTRGVTSDATQRACSELYRVLEVAMGSDGLEALVRRALQVAAREHPWLSHVTAVRAADCPLIGLAEAAEGITAVDAADGYAALLGTIVSLLTTFIGEDLTLRFVRHAWPNVSLIKLEGHLHD